MNTPSSKSPRRRWHPSQWNLARVGSAVGATIALGACGDDTTVTTESNGSTDLYAEDWTDYADYSDYSEYSDWSEYSDYSDYSDYADWSEEGPYYECYVDEDCGVGMACIGNYCVPAGECTTSSECGFDEFCDQNANCIGVPLPAQCLAPALQEIPLPAEVGGMAVALHFVNLDDDPAQELLVLRDDALVIVDGGQAITVPHSAYALDGLATTDVDGDGSLDVVATSSTKLNSRVFLADGLGGFVDTGTGPGMMLDFANGADWPSGGPGELIARSQADEGLRLSNVGALLPDIEVVNPGPISAVVVGQFNGDSDDDSATLIACEMAVVELQGDNQSIGADAIGPPGPCAMTAGDFDGDAITDLVTLRHDETFSVVTAYAPVGDPYHLVGLIGPYTAAQPTRFGGAERAILIQAGTGLEYLFADPDNWSWCRGSLDELPPVQGFASADFDGDGEPELAVLGADGAVTLWSKQ